MRSSGEGYARGFSKFINPEKEESLIAQMPIYAQHNILKRVWEDDVPQLMSDDEKTYKAAKITLTQSTKKDSSKMKIAAKNAILLPFQTNEEDGTLTFLPFKFDEKKAQDAQILKSIAKLNDYGDDVGLFVTAYRRQSQQTLPVVGNLNEISMDTFPDYFPRLKHAIELYKRGAWKKQENIKAEEVRNIVGYLNNSSNFNQEGSLAKLSALALIQPVEEEDLITSKYANYKMLKFDKTKVDAKRNEIFKRFTGATVDDFNVRFDANTDVVTKLTKYVRNEVNETTSPGGFVRGLKKTFGALAAPSGQVAQLVQFIAGTDKRYNVSQGGLKKGTTFATLEAIVRKIKDEGGIEAELSAIKENEGLMIVLAANMARALDPAGRLSNQDFEVQLKRLGDSGFFGTKAGSLRSLKSVVDEFNTQFKKLEAFKVIADNSSRGFSRPQLQILKANKVFDSMETRTRVLFGENKGGGIVTFDESKTQTLNSLIGPNGGPTTIKIDTNGKEHFFEGNVKVPRSFYNESQGSGVNQNNNTGQNLKPNNQIENNQEQQTITVKSSDIMGGTNSTGFILRGMEGRYRQLPDGSFTRIK